LRVALCGEELPREEEQLLKEENIHLLPLIFLVICLVLLIYNFILNSRPEIKTQGHTFD